MLPKTLLTLFGLPVLIMSVPDEDNSRSPSFTLRKVEGTKRVTRNRTSNKDRQHNGKKTYKNKDRQHNGKKETSTKKQSMIYKILI